MKVRLVVVQALVWLLIFASGIASAQEVGPPNAITDLVCKGERAIVFQSVTETGDGVTLSLYQIVGGQVVPTSDPCGNESNLWAFVEPWGKEDQNADSMFVGTWSELAEVAGANDWPNGSGWLQLQKLSHPLVVSAADVMGRSTLGLNPNEDQFQTARRGWVIQRALELLGRAGVSPSKYCSDFQEKLADYLCYQSEFVAATPVVGASSRNAPIPTSTPVVGASGRNAPIPTSTPVVGASGRNAPEITVVRNTSWLPWLIALGVLLAIALIIGLIWFFKRRGEVSVHHHSS
jgi:hypothetical protein